MLDRPEHTLLAHSADRNEAIAWQRVVIGLESGRPSTRQDVAYIHLCGHILPLL